MKVVAGTLTTVVEQPTSDDTDTEQWRSIKHIYSQMFYRYPAYNLCVLVSTALATVVFVFLVSENKANLIVFLLFRKLINLGFSIPMSLTFPWQQRTWTLMVSANQYL